MADKQITELTAATALTGSEVVHTVQGANSRQTTVKDIANLAKPLVIVTPNASFTLALTDKMTWKRMINAATATVTVPTNATVAFGVGDHVTFQRTNAAVQIAAAAGVTIERAPGTLANARGVGSVISLVKVATDTWALFGDLEIAP